VALICAATLLAGDTEGLAWATACPNRSSIGPSCEAQGVTPSADAGEEVALVIFGEVTWLDINNAPFVYVTRRDQSARDQLPQPRRSHRVNLVVVR
jgi:hypothetical protein